MRHFKATLEYDGTEFAGFQWQHGTRTVQDALEAAIKTRTGQTVRVTGAGRTDAGVHALGQVVSFACETRIPTDRMTLALNTVLPRDMSVTRVEEVDTGFSARFSASSRVYVYLILNRPVPSALWRRYSAFVREPLDVAAMQAGAHHLLGEQNFASFTNELEPGKSACREVMRCQLRRHGTFVMLRIEASSFLRGMVRCTMGTLIDVGLGKRSPDDLPALLAARNRTLAGPSAPPQGLCLLKVRYGQRRNYTTPTEATAQQESGGEE